MDPYFFEFVVGPPVEYICFKLDAEATEKAETRPVQTKPKSRTMWDLPDPYVPRDKRPVEDDS